MTTPQRFPGPRRPALEEVPELPAVRTVAVVGLGYVGLPTALALLATGHEVIGLDVSARRLVDIHAGRVDLGPDDLRLLDEHTGSGRFRTGTDPAAVAAADVVLICVPTPIDHHRLPDATALADACRSVVAQARTGQTVVLTSTTWPGCTRELLAAPLAARGLVPGRDVFVAFAPERIDPGVAEHSPRWTPRVVGGVTPTCTERAAAALAGTARTVHAVSSPEAAELAKLLENTFRAVNISLVNEFADIARLHGVDINEVVTAAGSKPYGFMAFRPGPGVGGHCIPCDPHYLLWQLRSGPVVAPVTAAAMEAIAARPHAVAARARELLADAGVPVRGARVLVVGVTYKPDVADVRESPALTLLEVLQRAGAVVAYTDPHVPYLSIGDARVPAADPAAEDWDLVVTHTLHRGVDHGWIAEAPRVLDAAFGLPPAANRYLP